MRRRRSEPGDLFQHTESKLRDLLEQLLVYLRLLDLLQLQCQAHCHGCLQAFLAGRLHGLLEDDMARLDEFMVLQIAAHTFTEANHDRCFQSLDEIFLDKDVDSGQVDKGWFDVHNLALPGFGDLSFRRQFETIEVVNHLFDDFGVVSIAKIVKLAVVRMGFEIKNARDRFLSMC
jgi:hypothetical protein